MDIPKPPNKPPKSIVFEFKTYQFIDEKHSLQIPIRPPDADKKTTRRFNDQIKSIVIEMEASNDRYAIFAHRGNSWWQIGGRSLLFYIQRFQNECSLYQLKPRHDSDFGKVQWPIGVDCAMVKNIPLITSDLVKKARCQIILKTPEIIIARFPIKFSDDEIRAFEKIQANKTNRINALLVPKEVYPQTRQALDDLQVTVINSLSHLSKYHRDAWAHIGIDLLNSLSLDFVSMCNGRIEPLPFFENAYNKICRFCDWLVIANNFHVFDIDTIFKISYKAASVRDRIKNDLTQIREKSK